MPAKPLVDLPAANKFRNNAKISTWRKIWFGDPDKLPKAVQHHIIDANNALTDGFDLNARIADDPTKTVVAQHEAAKIGAEKAIAKILAAKAGLHSAGQAMIGEASEEIDEAFALHESRRPVYDRAIDWINSKATQPGGIGKIRDAMKQDRTIVTVLSHYPSCMFELEEGICKGIVIDGYMHHTPDAANKMLEGQKVVETATKYDDIATQFRGAAYNETIAQQAGRRTDP